MLINEDHQCLIEHNRLLSVSTPRDLNLDIPISLLTTCQDLEET